jgi:heat shock protein HslJ
LKIFKQLSLLLISLALFACSPKSANSMASENIALSQIQKKWQLESIDGNPINAEINSTLNVNEQEKVTGKLGCNNFFGTLQLQDNRLKIAPLGSTRMSCSGTSNDVEMIVSSVLSNWSEVQLTENRLSLAGNKHTLNYRAD